MESSEWDGNDLESASSLAGSQEQTLHINCLKLLVACRYASEGRKQKNFSTYQQPAIPNS